MTNPTDRELDDLIASAEASLHRQQNDIDAVLAKVSEAHEVMAAARAELDAESDDALAERAEEEKQARTGALGPERKMLQQRLDANETSWADVMTGRDEHESAEAYRREVGQAATQVVEKLREDDAEFADAFDRFGPENPVQFPPTPTNDDIVSPGTTFPDTDRADPDGPSLGQW